MIVEIEFVARYLHKVDYLLGASRPRLYMSTSKSMGATFSSEGIKSWLVTTVTLSDVPFTSKLSSTEHFLQLHSNSGTKRSINNPCVRLPMHLHSCLEKVHTDEKHYLKVAVLPVHESQPDYFRHTNAHLTDSHVKVQQQGHNTV